MSEFSEIQRCVSQLNRNQLIAINLCCAEKTMPIVATLGLPSTLSVCISIVNECRYCLTDHSTARDMNDMEDVLRKSPEWECDDPSYLPFIVSSTLDVYMNTINVARRDDAHNYTIQTMSLVLDIMDAIDSSCNRYDPVKVHDLRKTEAASQCKVIAMISGGTTDADLYIRSEVDSAIEGMRNALPKYVFVYVRDLFDMKFK